MRYSERVIEGNELIEPIDPTNSILLSYDKDYSLMDNSL